jgi:predicted DNA-binding WGR domain protein
MPRYELKDGKSNKFWEITQDGDSFTVRYGRIGTDGQTSTKTFASVDKATAEAEKLTRSKTKKGYLLVEGADEPADSAGNGRRSGRWRRRSRTGKVAFRKPRRPRNLASLRRCAAGKRRSAARG